MKTFALKGFAHTREQSALRLTEFVFVQFPVTVSYRHRDRVLSDLLGQGHSSTTGFPNRLPDLIEES